MRCWTGLLIDNQAQKNGRGLRHKAEKNSDCKKAREESCSEGKTHHLSTEERKASEDDDQGKENSAHLIPPLCLLEGTLKEAEFLCLEIRQCAGPSHECPMRTHSGIVRKLDLLNKIFGVAVSVTLVINTLFRSTI